MRKGRKEYAAQKRLNEEMKSLTPNEVGAIRRLIIERLRRCFI